MAINPKFKDLRAIEVYNRALSTANRQFPPSHQKLRIKSIKNARHRAGK